MDLIKIPKGKVELRGSGFISLPFGEGEIKFKKGEDAKYKVDLREELLRDFYDRELDSEILFENIELPEDCDLFLLSDLFNEMIRNKKFNNKSLNLIGIVNTTRELCSYKLSGITTNSTSKKHELQI